MLGVGPLVIKDETSLEQVESLLVLDLLAKSIGAIPRKRLRRESTIATVKEVRLNQPYDNHTTKKRHTRQPKKNKHCSEESLPLSSPVTKMDHEGAESLDPYLGLEELHHGRQSVGCRKTSTSTLSSSSSNSDGELTPANQVSHVQQHAIPDKPVLLRGNSTTGGSLTRRIRSRSSSVHVFSTESSTTSTVIHFHKSNLEHKEFQTIVNDVLDIIKNPARGGKKGLCHSGYIYILQDLDKPGYVKIGRTEHATRRKSQIKRCRQQRLEWVGEQDLMIQVAYHERLEQIIHADLHNERHYFECTCHHAETDESKKFTKHGEWFKIDPETAKRKVEQWRNWMRLEPYKMAGARGEGDLKGDWKRRVKYFQGRAVSKPEERWTGFMVPFYMAPMNDETRLQDVY